MRAQKKHRHGLRPEGSNCPRRFKPLSTLIIVYHKIPKSQVVWRKRNLVKKTEDISNKHDSGMDISVIRNVPSVLENPIIVVDSKTVEGRKVVLGEVYDKNNKLVVVALELNPTSRSGKTSYTDIIKIASSQGRSHIQSLLDGEIRYVDANKKRVQDWLNANRLQLPLRSTNMNSNYSIPQNYEKSRDLEKTQSCEKIKPSTTHGAMPVKVVVNDSNSSIPQNSEKSRDLEKIS